jgi:hypothetical protein
MPLGENQRFAIKRAGTVAVPSPFPAFGRLSQFVNPASAADKEQAYYTIEQKISDTRIVTWFIPKDDVQAVRVRPEKQPQAPIQEWEIKTPADLTARAQQVSQRSGKGQTQQYVMDDTSLYPAAIAYVPANAPVLVRLELGLTAGEGADPSQLPVTAPCCCLPPNPPQIP